MSESINMNNELENEMTLDMSYFWYSHIAHHHLCAQGLVQNQECHFPC